MTFHGTPKSHNPQLHCGYKSIKQKPVRPGTSNFFYRVEDPPVGYDVEPLIQERPKFVFPLTSPRTFIDLHGLLDIPRSSEEAPMIEPFRRETRMYIYPILKSKDAIPQEGIYLTRAQEDAHLAYENPTMPAVSVLLLAFLLGRLVIRRESRKVYKQAGNPE